VNRIPGFRSADKTRLVVSIAGKYVKRTSMGVGEWLHWAEGRHNQQQGRMEVLGDCVFLGTFADAHIPLD